MFQIKEKPVSCRTVEYSTGEICSAGAPANEILQSNAELMLDQRQKRCTSPTYGQYLFRWEITSPDRSGHSSI